MILIHFYFYGLQHDASVPEMVNRKRLKTGVILIYIVEIVFYQMNLD